MHDLAILLAKGLEKLNLTPMRDFDGESYRFLGFYTKNREESFLCEIGGWFNSIANVMLYDTFGEKNISLIINQTELETIVVSDETVRKILAIKKNSSEFIKNLIIMDNASSEIEEEAKELGVTLIPYQDILTAGREAEEIKMKYAEPSNLITLCYSSGTTGDPKVYLFKIKN